MKRVIFLLAMFLLLISVTLSFAQGVKKKRLAHDEYGNVVINNFSDKNNIPPVVFNHWLHRAKYTCKVCHIEIGFAMQAGGTKIKEADNKNGLYCGACHNGKEAFGPEYRRGRGNAVIKDCDRCHSYGKTVRFEKDFYEFTNGFPKAQFGNGVDWLEAEKQGLLKIKDYLKGFSAKKGTLTYSGETELKAKVKEMPNIIFSHKKHAVWNGCEICHPDIFGVKKGVTKYSMQEIFEGKYCGACHGKVAFSNYDCHRCHAKEVN